MGQLVGMVAMVASLPQAWLSLYRDLGQGDSLASLDIQDRCILAHVAAGGTFSRQA